LSSPDWWQKPAPSEACIERTIAAADEFHLGRYWDERTGRTGPKLTAGNKPIIIIGHDRSGGNAGIGSYNDLQLSRKSWFLLVSRGAAAAICAPCRRKPGAVRDMPRFAVAREAPPRDHEPQCVRNPGNPVYWAQTRLYTWRRPL
jgi:hypothetical protein